MGVTPGKTARAAQAREALVARHAELQGVLDHWAGALAVAVDSGGPVRPVRFLADEVLPHARAEERTLYGAARRDPDTSPLVRELISEHRALASMTGRLGEPAQRADTAVQAAAISVLFGPHPAAAVPPTGSRQPSWRGWRQVLAVLARPAGCEAWEHPAR